MRDEYGKQLASLDAKLAEMGQLLITQIEGAMRSFRERDGELAKKIIGMDKVCNEKEKEIEQLSMTLLLLQQPVASDLRNVSASLKMVTDMERMGDQAADIAEIVLDMKDAPISRLGDILENMYNETITLTINAMNCFEEEDSHILIKLMEDDDKIDDYFDKVKDEAISLICTTPEVGHDVMDYVMAAKHLEKLADYAVHVIRWVYYYLEGVVPDKPKKQIVR